MARCIALSLFIDRGTREDLVEGLLGEFPESETAGSLVFLPGNVPERRREYDNAWANRIAKKFNVHLFAEKGEYRGGLVNKGTMLFSPDSRPVNVTGGQLLFTSASEREDYARLVAMINDGSRSVEAAGRKITLLLCGENNLVEIRGRKPFSAGWRYPELGVKKPGGILFNPIHSRMGNGGKLEERFRFLTSPGGGGYKHAVALANSYHGVSGWPKDGFALFTNGDRVDVPAAAEIGERDGRSKGIAFAFTL